MSEGRRGVGRPSVPVPLETLLDAARDEFALNGYAGASMREVSERAGVTKASLYYHFRDKEALYIAVLQRVVLDLQSFIGGALSGPGGFQERLDRLGALVVEYLATRPGAGRLLVREMADGGPYIQGPGRPAIAATLQRTREFLEAGMQAGDFRRRDPRHLALSIVGLHLFYFAASGTAGEHLGVDVLSPEAVRARQDAVVDQVRCLVIGRS